MMKPYFLGLFLVSLAGSGVFAQTISGADSSSGSQPRLSLPSSSPDDEDNNKPAKATQATQAPQGPTTIDSVNMDYDEKTRLAIFSGENYGVFVKDPAFTIYCDKLTAYMRKGGAPAGEKGMPSATAAANSAKAGGTSGAAASKGGGLQRAVAEGSSERPVVIVQDKAASEGQEAQHNVGIAQKADYNADTGDIKLTGWPRVSQGINTQIATSQDTIMIMNKEGKTMKTIGPSHSVIQEKEQPKKSDKGSESPAESPAPSTQ